MPERLPPPKPSPAPSEGKVQVERRTSGRVHLHVEVSLTSESHFFAGLSGDLSRGGIFVSTYQSLELGCEVQVEFELQGRKVVAEGTVKWKRAASDGIAPGVGIAFAALSPDDRVAVERFCTQRPPLYVDVGDRESTAG